MQFHNAIEYKKQVKRLYKTAFPFYERSPFWLLMKRRDNGRDTFYAITENDEFLGLAYTIKKEKFVYLFFFAVTEEKRCLGYGAKILNEIRALYPNKTIILAIEDTEDKSAKNYAERIRRLKFYERNGFRRLFLKFDEIGVVYELLGTEEGVTKTDFLKVMEEYSGTFLYKIIYRNN